MSQHSLKLPETTV